MNNPKFKPIMKSSMKALLITFLILFFSCQNDIENNGNVTVVEKGLRIIWDETSIVNVATEGFYPRLRVLSSGEYLIAYESPQGDIMLKKSQDGIQWEDLGMAYSSFDYTNPENGTLVKVRATNPELIELDNGDVLLATNLRPTQDGVYPFSIAVKRSFDKGITWGEPDILYQGGNRFDNGCWEPSFLALPNGDIQLYFANETPYPDSHDQQISVLYSKDQGVTWSSGFKTVSYRAQFRDGMPVAVHDDIHIYVAIEDNVSGQFKPYIVKNAINESWDSPVSGSDENRYNTLKDPLPDYVYAGAPYLIKTSGGYYVMSYQSTGDRADNWELATMEVVISDTPSNFRNPSRPFKVPLNREAKWNSLTDLGNDQIAALSTTNFQSSQVGIWMVKGKIVND
ncbi:exo-alpha-sialidase [Belliella sp. DSM 111904]|uniref:Exo-alpha-sialidase n=1 Tax=Belliella filtrata TaxID=2923435 RepID=A0ABS9V4H2_9BACT|nr:exo-alpha-sialidase [Belliella filtrata]MCH7411301.1 exo-alpha-sialidase [Belliella filtrata]